MADGGGEIVEGKDEQPGHGGTAAGAGAFTRHGAPDGGGYDDPREAPIQRLQAARALVTSRVEHNRLKRDVIEHVWARQPDA